MTTSVTETKSASPDTCRASSVAEATSLPRSRLAQETGLQHQSLDLVRVAFDVLGIVLDQADIAVIESCAGVFELSGLRADRYRLEFGDCLGHGTEGGLGRLATQAPVVRTFGPDHPGFAVGRPFGRHAETVRTWRSGQCGHRFT